MSLASAVHNSEINIGKSGELSQRVSGIAMTLLSDPWQESFYFECKIQQKRGVRTILIQPLGGGVLLRDANALREISGGFNFDSRMSKDQNDFRIYVSPRSTQRVLTHLQHDYEKHAQEDIIRELVEEARELAGITITSQDLSVKTLASRVLSDNKIHGYRAMGHGEPSDRVFFLHHTTICNLSACRLLKQKTFSLSQLYARQFQQKLSNYLSSHAVDGDEIKTGMLVRLRIEDVAKMVRTGLKRNRFNGLPVSEVLTWMIKC